MNLPNIDIQNVIASFRFNEILDLEKVHLAFLEESEYDESIFKCNVVVLRVKQPRLSFLVYRTGTIICTGAKRIKDAEDSHKLLTEMFKNANIRTSLKSKAKIQNIVATVKLGKKLDLEKLASVIQNTEYDTENFSGLVYRIGKSTMLLFSNGKVVCVGNKRYDDIEKSLKKLLIELKNNSLVSYCNN